MKGHEGSSRDVISLSRHFKGLRNFTIAQEGLPVSRLGVKESWLHSTTIFYKPASECILILEADCYTVELYIDLAYI
jgi:hypothetical protein